ncbi:MAG: tRNA (adenine(22)-N(1))-methyltransferase [Bacilli bacterium]
MAVSKRIKEICKYIDLNSKVADIGCDHGYLILEALSSKKILYAQLIDNKIKPLEKAKSNLKNIDLNVDYTLSNGLDELNPKVDTIVLAGMGGLLIKDIIKKNFHRIENKSLIIQANNNLEKLRKFLYDNSIYPVSEKIIFERSYFYQIMLLRKTKEIRKYDFIDLYLGMKLKKDTSLTMYEYCISELKKYNTIKESLFKNKEIEIIDRKIQILNEKIESFNS